MKRSIHGIFLFGLVILWSCTPDRNNLAVEVYETSAGGNKLEQIAEFRGGDPEKDEVYYTPLYYTLSHFSRFIRPGAVRIGFENTSGDVMATAARNTDGSVVVVILNMDTEPRKISLALDERSADISISPQAIQTVLIAP